MIGPRGYLPFRPTFFDATSWLGHIMRQVRHLVYWMSPFLLFFRQIHQNATIKNKKSDMGVKGLNWPLLIFFYLSLSLRKSPNMPPEICCNENFRIQIPSNSYMYMNDNFHHKKGNNINFKEYAKFIYYGT